MTNPDIIANLCSVLAKLYSSEESQRRVAADAGLDGTHIAFSPNAQNSWRAIWSEAEKANKANNLLDIVLREYGENRKLHEARTAYLVMAQSNSSIGQDPIETTNERPDTQAVVADKPIDIFLSYSRSDSVLMRRLYTDLQNAGFTVWVDQTNLTPGTPSWQNAIEAAINEARCFVVILSPEAKQSEWVGIEISIAKDRNLPIIPLLAKGDTQNAISPSLRNTNWIDLRHDYHHAVMEQLVSALQSYLRKTPGQDSIKPIPHPRPIPWWMRIHSSVKLYLGIILGVVLLIVLTIILLIPQCGSTTVSASDSLVEIRPLGIRASSRSEDYAFYDVFQKNNLLADDKAIDHCQNTWWLSQAGMWEKASLAITFDQPHTISRIVIYKPPASKHRWIKTLLVQSTDHAEQTVTFNEVSGWDSAPLAQPITTNIINLTVRATTNSTTSPYVEIAEITFFGPAAIHTATPLSSTTNTPLQTEPMSATDSNRSRVSYDNQGKYDLAISYNTKDIELNASYMDVHFNRRLTYQQQGKKQAAIAIFRKQPIFGE